MPPQSFSALPLNKDDPPYSAWGRWGPADQLGTLNYLTPELVANTAKLEIRTGKRVGLDMPLDFFSPVPAGKERAQFKRELVDYKPVVVNDDVITLNTQSSSQWDSFRHFAYQEEAVFYGGITQSQIHDPENPSPANGLQPWTERQIAGRGILIDFASYAAAHSLPEKDKIFDQHGISIEHIKAIAAEQNVEFQTGDILLIRTGYTQAYAKLSKQEKVDVAVKHSWIGLGQSREAAEWLWERQFAAVAADCPGFETRPQDDPSWMLHPILLAGWGTPIGELFDLEGLSVLCKKHKRWSFFLTSAVLNYSGAVASPPNAMAIF